MKKKVAYVINHLSFFYSHVMPQALEARKQGFEIKVFCGQPISLKSERFAKKQLRIKKINYINCHLNSTSLNLFNDFIAFYKIIYNLHKFRPDIIHITTAKAQILAGFASIILNTKNVIIFISGMGYLFSNNLTFIEKIYKKIFFWCQKLILKNKKVKIIVENKNDHKYFINYFSLKKEQIFIVKGSGVDLNKFKKVKKKRNKIILLPARVIKEKGIIEFIKAAKILQKYKWKFIVAGALDYKKSSGFKIKDLNTLNTDKLIKFIGYQKNIYKILKKTAIVCLPSYREGLPKSLCEAAACGIPIVTTNTIGCTEVVKQNFNGELCRVKDHISLAKKIEKLILNVKLRYYYGKNSILYAKKNYDIKLINKKILSIYNKV
jgi:glycosyltransferase involved in cell wall biosynthesis